MNCKPGDLVICVRSVVGNEGKICTVIRLASKAELNEIYIETGLGQIWVTDRTFKWANSFTNRKVELFLFPDFALMPIRGSATRECESTDEAIAA